MLGQNNEKGASLPGSRSAASAQGRASSSGKSDSQASVSGSDASGLRRSTRSLNNSSPGSLRKSERLQRQSPPATPPSSKKKGGNPSPLRRSVRENKSHSLSSKDMGEKGSPSSKGSKQQTKGSNVLDSSKEKTQKQDQTLKQFAREVKDKSKQNCSPEVGNKRKKRLDARSYKHMFKPLKKSKISESGSDKKSRLENCDDSGGSGPEKADEGGQERSDGEEMNGDSAKDIDDDAGDSNSCEVEDGGSLLASSGHDVSSPSSPRIEAVRNSDKTEEVPANGSALQDLSNQGVQLTLDKLSDDGDGSGFSQRGVNLAASVVTRKCAMDASSVSSPCKISNNSEDCAKCLRKQRLDHDSPEQELCCCLLNTMNDIDDFKDRGQCGAIVTTEFVEDLGRGVKQSAYMLDVQRSMCDTCNLAGKLLHCSGKGCGRSFHAPCSLNPEENIYLSNWYCSDCTKKRLSLGVHSVSEGIEAILDVREVDVSNTEGKEKQKQYFVKYKGLAHIHNRWVPEMQLVYEASELHTKLGKQKEWNPNMSVPHRLLRRRSVIVDDKPIDQEISLKLKCHHEWLVKWCCLDYDQATWEPEDLSFFKKPETQRLIEEYETHHNKARKPPLHGNNETQEKRKDPYVKLGKHMIGGADSCYLNSVNKLREYHYKGHNAVLLDEQDRCVKVIHLVSSLVTQGSRPFLIISPYASLPSWEAEFMHLAASINVVVYGGNADARHIIRTLEFYEEGGQVLFQVLLSSPEALSEDVEELKGIKWEAVIIDDCQQSGILTRSGCIKNLDTGWRLLLMNAKLRDNVTDYINILSLLDPGVVNQDPELLSNSNADINALKDRLSSFIICARFIEYWVPVEISYIQLERYCYSMLSEFSALRSFWKNDPVGSLREILISLRKCCDHPYIVDWQLQSSLTKDLPPEAMIEVDIQASGKLHFLQKLLFELKNLDLKVLILFQSTGGSGRDTTALFLEDLLRFKFGRDSYEYVASNLITSKKQAACNQFNSLRERSFFLLETRACSPAIKLSLVDAVILFDSDWNLHIDFKALQRITIDSKLEQIKVFRLYCPFTVEEKVLILAKNDMILDSTLQSISPSTSHMLLMWGSSNLFSRLDEFHQDNILDYKDNIAFGSSFMTDVSKEIISLFQNRNNIYSSKYISLARQNGGCYLKCIPLIGEQKIQQEEVSPPDFWTKLLEGKQPQWKYLTGSSQRHRKRVHYSDEYPSEVHIDEAAKRRKKLDAIRIGSPSQKTEPRLEKQSSGSKEQQESGYIGNLHNHLRDIELLKPTLLDLCEALLLEDKEKRLAEQFLKYLVENYRVTREPETTLQAFLLSVCWIAAEELKNKVDHKKSLTVARGRLGFNCSEREAEDIISKLKPLMDIFLCLRNKNPESERISIESPLGNTENVAVELEEHMKKVEMECGRQMEKLKIKHNEELEKFEKSWEELQMKLEKWCKAESTTIRFTHANSSIGIDKLKALDNDYAKKREELEKQKSITRKELGARHKVEKDVEQKKLAGYIKRVKSLGHHKLLEESHGSSEVNSNAAETIGANKKSNGTLGINGNLSVHQNFRSEAIASLSAENLENANEQRVSCANDDSLPSIVNIPASKGPNGLDKESNGGVGINGNLPMQKYSEKEAVVSVLAENLENTDEQRVNCENDDSITAIESIPASNGPDTSTCSPEQPSASTGQIEKDTNQIDDVVVDRSTAVASNQINGANMTGPLLSSVSSFMEHPNALMSQGLGDESHNEMAGEQVGPAMGTHTTPLGDTSSYNRSNHVPSDLLRNEETHSATEVPVNEWVTHYNDQLGVASNGRLDIQPNGNHPSNMNTTTQRHQDHMGNSPTGRRDIHPIGTHASIVGTNTPRHQDHNRGRVGLGEAVSQPFSQMPIHVVPANFFITNETNVPVARGAIPAHSSHANRMQVPTNSLATTSNHFDPLQSEVDRIRKEIGNLMTVHEQKKSQLKSECDKEIEELIAQIKRNYDKKIDEAEVSFSLKRKELETCQNKVVMHKMLAEAFRSKCTDYKAATRMQQLGNPSSSVDIASQLHITRPFSPAMSSASGPPSAISTIRGVHAQARISHVDSVALTAGQQQIRREARAPAPHIQPFRPASSAISSSSMPSGDVLVTQPPNNPSSNSALQHPPQPPLLSTPVQLNSHGQSRQEVSMGSGTLSLSLSATQLLMDITRQHDANLHSSNVPSLPDNVLRSSESWDISQFEEATNVQPSSSNLPDGDVVCLSDDD